MLLKKRKAHIAWGVPDRRNVCVMRLEVQKIAIYQIFFLRNHDRQRLSF